MIDIFRLQIGLLTNKISHKMVEYLELCPKPRWVCYSAPPNSLAGNNQCNIENCYVMISYILGILHSCHV